MIQDIQLLIEGYHRWLKQKTRLREVEGTVEITTPYVDRHNDNLQLFVLKDGDQYVLTDDGYTISDLELSGCRLDTPKRQELLRTTLNGFGVTLSKDGELRISAKADNFARQKHNLVQAMLAVNDLFYVAQPNVASLFKEDVATWLDLSGARFTPSVKFPGKSGYDHLYDFVIPANRSQKAPERIVQAISRPSRDSAGNLIYSWLDTKEARPAESRAYAVLNDADSAVPSGVIDALRNYDIRAVGWSQRDSIAGELAA